MTAIAKMTPTLEVADRSAGSGFIGFNGGVFIKIYTAAALNLSQGSALWHVSFQVLSACSILSLRYNAMTKT